MKYPILSFPLFLLFFITSREARAMNPEGHLLICQMSTGPQFPGGDIGWMRFIDRYVDRHVAFFEGANTGRYEPVVSFAVDTLGNILDIKIEFNPGYGTAEELVRVIKLSPKWLPALHKGKKVVDRKIVAIGFSVVKE